MKNILLIIFIAIPMIITGCNNDSDYFVNTEEVSSSSQNEILPYWYPVLKHWRRSDRKDDFEVTTETYIANVSLEEPEYDVHRLGSAIETFSIIC